KQIGTEPTADFPWLVEPDREVLQAWMQHLLGQPEQARAMGEAGRQRVHSAFTWARTVEGIEHRLAAWQRREPVEASAADEAIVVAASVPQVQCGTGFLTRPGLPDGLGNPSHANNLARGMLHPPGARRRRCTVCIIAKNEEK